MNKCLISPKNIVIYTKNRIKRSGMLYKLRCFPAKIMQYIVYVWEYPIRVYDEYHKVKSDIRKLKNGK